MKKTVIFSTVLVLVLAFSGCGGSNNSSSNGTNNNTNVTTGNNTNVTNPDDNNTKHPYAYGYSCEAGVTVNSYKLPPCPDPELNDKTLLGIDSNNNGVRDDVERWLIVRYKDNHKIVTEIGFQTARAAQEIVKSDPLEAQETDKIMRKAVDCNYYFENYANLFGDPTLIDHTIITSTAFKTVQLNTHERIKAYLTYDKALSGKVYRLTEIDELKAQCAFDINAFLGE